MDQFATRAVMNIVVADEKARTSRITHAMDAYLGQYADTLKKTGGQADDNTKPNLARVIVDKSKAFLMGKAGPTFKVEGSAEAQTWLDACLKANRFTTRCKELAQNGSIAGHVFVKISGARADRGEQYPRLIVQDPATVTVTWGDDDITDVFRYRVQYSAVDPRTGKPVTRKQVIERNDVAGWTVIDSVSTQGGAWQEEARVDWPFAWSPMHDCQNLVAPNVYYGLADLEPDILHLIRRIHFVLSNSARLNRIHSHPKIWGKGFKKSDIDIAPDQMTILPSDNAALGALEAMGDMAGSLALHDKLSELLFMLARIPPITMSKMQDIGAIAGIALKILYAPIKEMNDDKQGTYGDMFVDMATHLLEMGGHAGAQVTIEWPNTVPENEAEAQQMLLSDMEAGLVSEETAAMKRGYDWKQEKGKIDARKQENMSNFDTPPNNIDGADRVINDLTRR